jgi:hypothetical protein
MKATIAEGLGCLLWTQFIINTSYCARECTHKLKRVKSVENQTLKLLSYGVY